MVALQHQWSHRLFVEPMGGTRRTGDLDVFLDQLAVVTDLNKPGILNLFPAAIKPWRTEQHVKALPLAGRFARVHRRWASFEIRLRFTATGIHTSTIAILGFLYAPTVEDLDFIPALEIDSGVGFFRHDEFDVGFDISVLKFRNQVHRLAFRVIDHHACSRHRHELFMVLGIEFHSADYLPFPCWDTPSRQIFAIEQLLSSARLIGTTRGD